MSKFILSPCKNHSDKESRKRDLCAECLDDELEATVGCRFGCSKERCLSAKHSDCKQAQS